MIDDPLPPEIQALIEELGVEGYAAKVFAERPVTLLDQFSDEEWKNLLEQDEGNVMIMDKDFLE